MFAFGGRTHQSQSSEARQDQDLEDFIRARLSQSITSVTETRSIITEEIDDKRHEYSEDDETTRFVSMLNTAARTGTSVEPHDAILG
jgi:hypothetical protein